MIRLFNLTSNLHDAAAVKAVSESFIQEIENQLGEQFIPCDDFSTYSTDDCVIYVRTGGTEGIFRSLFFKEGSLRIPGSAPVRLLTSGKSNSLAASMEILSYLNLHGYKGSILHGDGESLAQQLRGAKEAEHPHQSIVKEFDRKGILSGKRYAVVGRPSDWLISSDVDYAKAKEVLGCELIDIAMDEFVAMVNAREYSAPAGLAAMNEPKFGRPISSASMQKAIDIYGAAKELVEKLSLDGLTIRCFDLLTAVSNTGCLALAQLNSEGYIATCEGDVPTMLTMAVGRELFGQSGFQVNLSKVDGDHLLFAHCTVPFKMCDSYVYDTHFESGIGVGIHGILPENVPAKIMKLSADLEHYILEDITLVCNQYENNLCRTQVIVEQSSSVSDYMLNTPHGNHHVIFTT